MRALVYVPHGRVPDQRGFAPAIVAWRLANAMNSVDTIFLAAQENGSSKEEQLGGHRVLKLPTRPVYRRLFQKITRLDPLPDIHWLVQAVHLEQPALVHAHMLEFPCNEFRRRARYDGPLLIHAHVTNRRFDSCRGSADAYIAVSKYVASRLVEQGYPNTRICVVENGVDLDTFLPPSPEQRASWRTRLRIPHDAVVILFAGRKQHVKGWDLFLRLAHDLLPKLPEIFILAIGPEPVDAQREPGYSQRQILRQWLSLSPRWKEMGAVIHAELAGYYSAADIVIAPSRAEPQGMVVREAMACGCCVIASAVGGIPESIRNGEDGLLVDPDLEALITSVISLVQNARERLRLSQAAAQRARKDFGWQISARRLQELYGRLSGQNA